MLLVAAAVVAPVNWWSRFGERAGQRQVVEWFTKPAVTTLILLAAVALDPQHEAMRWLFVAGFALCLVGDVLLMLPKEQFVGGLAAFLLGHLAFVAGFVAGGLGDTATGVAMALATVFVLVVAGRCILAGARRTDPALGPPVGAYLVVISSMAVVSGFHGDGWGIAGAGAFLLSDSLLGWNKFVAPIRHGGVAIMVTYHLALVGLLLALPVW